MKEHQWGRLDHNGEFDEMWIKNAFVHIERMNDTGFWIGIEAPGMPHISVNTGVHSGEWFFSVSEEKSGGGKFFRVTRPRRKPKVQK